MEVPAPFAAKIPAVLWRAGATKLRVGQVILVLPDGGERTKRRRSRHRVSRRGENSMPYLRRQRPIVEWRGDRRLRRPRSVISRARWGSILHRFTAAVQPGEYSWRTWPHSSAATPSKQAPLQRTVARIRQPGTRIKLAGVRRKIAEHLVESKKRIPHYSYMDECDVTELVRLRHGLREPAAQSGIKLTYLPFFVKAVGRGAQGSADCQ